MGLFVSARIVSSHVVPANVDDEIMRASRSHVLRVMHLIGTDEANVPRAQPHGFPGNGQFHCALANQHHFFPQVLMGRMIHFAWSDIALMTLHLETSVSLTRE